VHGGRAAVSPDLTVGSSIQSESIACWSSFVSKSCGNAP
jgi:hypothetical protein